MPNLGVAPSMKDAISCSIVSRGRLKLLFFKEEGRYYHYYSFYGSLIISVKHIFIKKSYRVIQICRLPEQLFLLLLNAS